MTARLRPSLCKALDGFLATDRPFHVTIEHGGANLWLN